MAKIKFTGEEALGRVADYVNKKLTFASTMPASPDTGTLVLYVGSDTASHIQGGIYEYDGTNWNLINSVKTIELTQDEYDALPIAVQNNGTIYFVTDAVFPGSIVSGFYNSADGKFYEEDTFETEIAENTNVIYIELSSDILYIYDAINEEYVQVGGSGSGTVIKYVSTLPVTGIEDIIYGIKGYNSFEETIADGFLDENVLFEKEDNLSGGYVYTPAEDIVLDASNDGITYKGFTSLAYDGTSDWTLTFDDTTDATLADGDTFYFKQPVDKFFAGDATNQKVIPFGSAGGGGGDYAPGEGITINNQVISVAPATNSTLGGVKPDDETLKVDATGTLSGNYEGGFNIKIDGHTISTKTFVGTLEEWNNLTSAQKAKFDTVNITDDNAAANVTPGHEVLDSTDTPLPQRTNIQFEGAETIDDSTNDITKVTITPYTAGDGIEIDDHEVSVTEDRPATFVGTTQEWDALTAAEKAQYKVVNLTNDIVGGEIVVVDEVEDGNLNPVTSNAVYDSIYAIRKVCSPGAYLPSIKIAESYTAELKQDISSGVFEKVFVGGYFEINGHIYDIAHLDYWYNIGENGSVCTTHHAVIVPRTELLMGRMNYDAISSTGYYNSDFRTGNNSNTALANIKAIIKTDFGENNILIHRAEYTSIASSGTPTQVTACSSDIDLMSEIMAYGANVYGTPKFEARMDKTQLKLFKERPDLLTIRKYWFLRDVANIRTFACVAPDGVANDLSADSFGVIRPAFAIC